MNVPPERPYRLLALGYLISKPLVPAGRDWGIASHAGPARALFSEAGQFNMGRPPRETPVDYSLYFVMYEQRNLLPIEVYLLPCEEVNHQIKIRHGRTSFTGPPQIGFKLSWVQKNAEVIWIAAKQSSAP